MADEFSPLQAFHGWDELFRVYEEQDITEKGIYKKDHTPEELSGSAVLTVEVVHQVIFCDAGGRLQRLNMYAPEAMDENDKYGGPYNLDGFQISGATGDSDVPTELRRKLTASNNVDAARKERALLMAESAKYISLGWRG